MIESFATSKDYPRMKPTGAIERVFRLGAAASLKREGFTKKGASFYREFKPGVFHIVRASPQRFSDADTTEIDIVLGATFARLREVFDQSPFPANPLSVMCDLSVQLDRTSSGESAWVVATQRATQGDQEVSRQILTALSERAYPFFQTIESVQSGFEVFLTTPQEGLSDLVALETKIAFLLALDRKQEACAEVRAALADRPPDADEPFAEALRDMARRLDLL